VFIKVYICEQGLTKNRLVVKKGLKGFKCLRLTSEKQYQEGRGLSCVCVST
jgi:hypothetical protein